MSAKLDALLQTLDRLEKPATLAELHALLQKLKLTAADLAECMRFADGQYQRNSVRAGRWYHAWVLCWKNGQRSPIHDHRGSACAVQVLRGTLTQTAFAFAPNGHVKATGSEDFPVGSLVLSADQDLHQVSNLQAGDADLVTLHIYSPPLTRMGTYTLTDRTRGEDVWVEERKFVTAFPENSETPVENVQGWVTPNSLFFVRNHFPEPSINRAEWRLQVAGCVERPRTWTWEELTALPQRSVFATVECAGNGRSFLKQVMPGVQWGAGAIGHAEWTGVPLRTVLDQAALKPEAVEILFEGADRGTEADRPAPMNFQRSLPLAKALDPNTLLVTRMNGELLQPNHGFPLRLFVPGWYGVASVKWLQRIEAINAPYRGYYQNQKYTVQRRTTQGVETVVVGPMPAKSEIIRPKAGAALGVGMNRIFGVAWAGEEAVVRVEVSTDGGQSWSQAELIGPRAPYSWVMWEYLWEVAAAGDYTLLARTTDSAGRVQASDHDPLLGGYQITFSRPLQVQVAAGQRAAAQHADAEAILFDMNAFADENSRLPLDVELHFSAGEGI
ncbi:MAG: molybdopterin-dependent oxidoreductase [Planctomycetia bacterium]|nr:molybdopterin-dependent oxidoreductase [Planctomycetia bacterium]